MLSKIQFKQDLDSSGRRVYALINIKDVMPVSKLPGEYLDDTPYFFGVADGRGLTYVTSDGSRSAEIGTVFRHREYVEFVQCLMDAGKRLTKINGRINRDKESWVGRTFTFNI